jgi:hypothetical protein
VDVIRMSFCIANTAVAPKWMNQTLFEFGFLDANIEGDLNSVITGLQQYLNTVKKNTVASPESGLVVFDCLEQFPYLFMNDPSRLAKLPNAEFFRCGHDLPLENGSI